MASLFSSWQLPRGFSAPILEGEEGAPSPPPFLRRLALEPRHIRELAAALRRGREEGLVGLPVFRIVEAADRVAARFLDPGDPLAQEALAWLGPTAGVSSPMARIILEGMVRDWTRPRLERLLEEEFGDPAVLDGFQSTARGGRRRALGLPVTFHLGAGSVPGVGATSLLRALLVKSAVLLKPGRGDVVLPVLLARGLAAAEPALASAVAVIYWPGSRTDLTGEALRVSDLVVAYGDDETVGWVRSHLPPHVQLRAYRHRLGVGMVGRAALGGTAWATARDAARAVVLFDQRGCTSPHVFVVEEGGGVSPRDWAALLGEALREMEETLPSGPLEPETWATVHQLRGAAELEEEMGNGVVVRHGGAEAPWTVVFHPGGELLPSCLGRVVRVVPVPDLHQGVALLSGWEKYLQTVGVAGAGEGAEALAEALARLGVCRITSLGNMPWPPPWWHHDGVGPLQTLVRWTDWEPGV